MNGRKDSARLHPLPVTEETEDTRLAVHGGNPVRRAPWPTYEKGAVFVHPEDEDAALRAIRSHLYFRYDYRSHQDTECGRFEEELRRYFGSKHALAVSSGTTALVLAIMASGIPPGSLIACPGFTFVATPSSITLAGCKPFLVDVDENLHMDIADLRRRWTPDIKAIMVVHMRGFAADMEALTRFAAEMGVPVFEDAVPALGTELKGRKLGTFGLAGARVPTKGASDGIFRMTSRRSTPISTCLCSTSEWTRSALHCCSPKWSDYQSA